jgi:hypothetical protein
VRSAGLVAKTMLFMLALAITSGVDAKAGSIIIRLKAAKGQVETFYRGKRLTDSGYVQLCAAGKARKADINFQRDTMNSGDTMAALLKEADCLGAKRSTGIDRKPSPKSATHTHARPRHTANKQP